MLSWIVKNFFGFVQLARKSRMSKGKGLRPSEFRANSQLPTEPAADRHSASNRKAPHELERCPRRYQERARSSGFCANFFERLYTSRGTDVDVLGAQKNLHLCRFRRF